MIAIGAATSQPFFLRLTRFILKTQLLVVLSASQLIAWMHYATKMDVRLWPLAAGPHQKDTGLLVGRTGIALLIVGQIK